MKPAAPSKCWTHLKQKCLESLENAFRCFFFGISQRAQDKKNRFVLTCFDDLWIFLNGFFAVKTSSFVSKRPAQGLNLSKGKRSKLRPSSPNFQKVKSLQPEQRWTQRSTTRRWAINRPPARYYHWLPIWPVLDHLGSLEQLRTV